MDNEVTIVSVTRVPVELLDLLRADAVKAGIGDGNAGVMRYCLIEMARQKRASTGLKAPGGLRAPDGA